MSSHVGASRTQRGRQLAVRPSLRRVLGADSTSATDRILARGFWTAARDTEGSVIVLGERAASADSSRT